MATDAEKLGNTVVLDYGSDTIKAGRARDVPSEHALSCITPSAVELRDPAAAAADADPLSGAPWPRGAAVEHGRVVDFDRLEALLHHVLYGRMGWQYGREDCLLIVEPVLASRAEVGGRERRGVRQRSGRGGGAPRVVAPAPNSRMGWFWGLERRRGGWGDC
jgi:hypothetical protein